MRHTSIKTVKGNRYLYFVYYEEGKKFENYCGPEGERETEKKHLRFRIAQLKKQRDGIVLEIRKLEGKK